MTGVFRKPSKLIAQLVMFAWVVRFTSQIWMRSQLNFALKVTIVLALQEQLVLVLRINVH
jgi:hypothetical protein